MEVFYAAEAAFERAIHDLSLAADWNAVLVVDCRRSWMRLAHECRRTGRC